MKKKIYLWIYDYKTYSPNIKYITTYLVIYSKSYLILFIILLIVIAKIIGLIVELLVIFQRLSIH